MTGETSLSVKDLRVEIAGGRAIVDGVSFDLCAGEILGLVGESGSGKTTTAMATLGYAGEGAEIVGGTVTLAGVDALAQSDRDLRRLRGGQISFVPQNPGSALNPSVRLGDAMKEVVALHRGSADPAAVKEAFGAVSLPESTEFLRRFPHQISGGQQQRTCIGIAAACRPPVLVLDEPTTGLDVVTQARVLEEVRRLQREQQMSMIYVTHDLSVLAQVADRVAVMYAGKIVEEGEIHQVLTEPRHPYTQGLIASVPDHARPRELLPIPGVPATLDDRPRGCPFEPRCSMRVDRCATEMPSLEDAEGGRVRCFRWRDEESAVKKVEPVTAIRSAAPTQPILTVSGLRAEHRGLLETVVAAENIDLELMPGHCLALVGESGSGKTTIARAIAGLHPASAGEIRLRGTLLSPKVERRRREERRAIQMVFQNSTEALNPTETIEGSIRRGLSAARGESRLDVPALLELVRLPSRLLGRYPAELSGGERQLVAIARALAVGPEILICDEITSALDVSVQAAVIRLLADLRVDLGISILFITHDLGVVAQVADEVLVLNRGDLCERGTAKAILETPQHAYTQELVAAAPSISLAVEQLAMKAGKA
jgi:peptide/nickel transport system ATP-binding protein